jgi:hypothetical protein
LTAKTHDGKATFDGIELGDVLKLAGVKFGEQLRGKGCALPRSRSCRRLSRSSPCPSSIAYTDRIIVLADRRDGKPLAEKEGPLRIVVADETQARWVRQVVSLTIRRLSKETPGIVG